MEIALKIARVMGLPNFHDKRKWIQFKFSLLFTSVQMTLALKRTAHMLTLTIQQQYPEPTGCAAQMGRKRATLRRLLRRYVFQDAGYVACATCLHQYKSRPCQNGIVQVG